MKPLVTDALGQHLEPLLPPPPPRRFRFPGRKPLDYRKILTGILFVLKTGIAWDDLPAALGCGCGKTCRHYLRLWHQAGVGLKLHAVLLAELHEADQIDWERARIDASFAQAPEGGEDTGPDRRPRHPVERDRDRRQRPGGHAGEGRAAEQAGGRRQARTQTGTAGALQGDSGYDSEPLRTLLRWLGITPVLGKRQREHGSGLGKLRWFVERTIFWLHGFGRLRRRLDRLTEIQEAFLRLGCSLICLRLLTP